MQIPSVRLQRAELRKQGGVYISLHRHESYAFQAASFIGKLAGGGKLDGPPPNTSATFEELARQAALRVGTLPIWVAHYIKVTETLRHLATLDKLGAPLYLATAEQFLNKPHRERHPQRRATIAKQFLKDFRPPKSLY